MKKHFFLIFSVIFCLTLNAAKGQQVIEVDDYLNKGSDSKAIKEAFRLANLSDKETTIKFANRIYTLDPSEVIPANLKFDFLFPVRSHLNIIGEAGTSLNLREYWVKPYNNKLGNFMLFGSRKFISNLRITSISVDFKGVANNLLTASKKVGNSFLYVKQGENISVSKVRVLNNPGRQSIYLGSATASGDYLMSNVTIQDCTFLNVADNLAGNFQDDHSSVYVAGNNISVVGNQFNAGKNLSNVATAIEGHTSNSKFVNNKIVNYSTGINIVAIDGDHVNVIYDHNSFDNVKKAFVFWGKSGKRMSNIKITGNTIRQAYVNYAIIRMLRTLNTYIDSLEISDNHFLTKSTDTKKTSVYGHGIEIGTVRNIKIVRNVFENINGRAITLVATNFDIQSIQIHDNLFKNVNSAKNPKYLNAIDFKAVGTVTSLSIENNKIDRDKNFYGVGAKVKVLKSSLKKNGKMVQ